MRCSANLCKVHFFRPGPRRARRNAAERQFLIEELMTRPALPPAPPKMTQCEKFGLLVADLMENIAARRRTAVMTKILDIIGEEEEEADD